MEATHGSGVDLVLNSLSGELLSASLKCVALDGAMIGIGKRDSEYPFLISIYDQEGASFSQKYGIRRKLRLSLESNCRQLPDYSLHSPPFVTEV